MGLIEKGQIALLGSVRPPLFGSKPLIVQITASSAS